MKHRWKQCREAVPRNLHADAHEDEGDDAQDSVHCGLRNRACDSRCVCVANVDENAEDDDGQKQPGVPKQILSKPAAFLARCERERDDEGAGAGRDGEGERVERLFLKRCEGWRRGSSESLRSCRVRQGHRLPH